MKTQDKYEVFAAPLLIFVFVLTWQFLVTLLDVSPFILPTPARIFVTTFQKTPLLLWHAMITFEEALLGLAIALVIGVGLAFWLDQSRFARAALQPIIAGFQSFPKESIAPLLIIWFGFGLTSKFILAASIAFFPVFIATYHGLQSVPTDVMNVLHAMKARSSFILLRVRFNYAIPSIIAGLRIGWTLSIIGAVVAEFMGSSAGLGHLVLIANSQFEVSLVFSVLIVLAVGGIGGDILLRLIARRSSPWYHSEELSPLR
jgi:NitT/TauT family transport system permease protein